MRFPDLLVLVKKLEERQRLLQFDLDQLRRDLIKALPEARQWLGPQSTKDSTVDSPQRSDDAPTLF